MNPFPLPSRLSPLLAVVLGLALGGCGEQAATTASGDAPPNSGTCALLLPAEITDTVGQPVGEGVDPKTVVPTCQWPPQGESSPFIPVAQITLVPDSAGSYDTWLSQMRKEYEESGFEFDATDYRRVDDVGDWAVYLADGGLLMVGQRGQLLQVMVSSGPDDARQIALARLALGRLP